MLITFLKRVFPLSVLSVMLLIFIPECSLAFDAVSNGPQESSMKLDKVYIQLLPEYNKPRHWDDNQPSLLVSFYCEFINCDEEDFFDYLYMPVPDESPMFTMSMVCETEKGMLYLPYELIDGYVRWKPTKPVKQMQSYFCIIEYYCNPIVVSDEGIKSFDFQFSRDGLISEAHLDVYMPDFSWDHVLSPAIDKHTVINNGTHVYSYEYMDVNEETPIKLAVQYYKLDHQPTGIAAEELVPGLYSSIRLEYIGVIIFALILLIMGVSVISLAPKNKNLADDEGLRKRNLRRLLLDGKIDEQTYMMLLYDEGKETQE